jgi:hypothetical protein
VGLPLGTVLNEPFMAYIEALRAAEGAEGADPEPFVSRIAAIVEEAKRMGDMETSVVAQALVGRTLRAFGRRAAARDAFVAAIEGATKLDSAPMIHEYEAELAEMGDTA